MKIIKKIAKWSLILFGGFILLMVIIGSNSQKAKDSYQAGKEAANKSNETKPYEKLSYKDAGNVENFAFLYAGSDKSEDYLEKLAKEIKSKECKKQCNIDLYDDKEAFNLQKQYDQMMSTFDTKQSDLDAWKKKNYVFVADHLLGYLEFSDEEHFNYYPYKDWYYKELKAK